MTRVLALTFGDESCASSFYRVYQYREPLRASGIELTITPATRFADWKSVPTFDVVLIQKKLLSVGKVRQLRRRTKRLIYDVDDAIWHPHGRHHSFFTNLRTNLRLKAICSAAHLCMSANNVLASHLRNWSSRVNIVPMALDEQRWTPRTLNPQPSTLNPQLRYARIGWAGHPVNFPYLEQIEPALVEIQTRFPNTEIAIFSGQRPRFERVKFVHLPFVPGTDAEVIRTFDIGLLPLSGNEFSAGKSPIKGLQYMASGVATIATPLAGTRELFGDENTARYASSTPEWVEALTRLIQNEKERREMQLGARRRFEANHALRKTAELLTQHLRGC